MQWKALSERNARGQAIRYRKSQWLKTKNQGLKAKLALQAIQMCEEQQGEHEEPKFHHEEEWMDGSTVLDYAVWHLGVS